MVTGRTRRAQADNRILANKVLCRTYYGVELSRHRHHLARVRVDVVVN